KIRPVPGASATAPRGRPCRAPCLQNASLRSWARRRCAMLRAGEWRSLRTCSDEGTAWAKPADSAAMVQRPDSAAHSKPTVGSHPGPCTLVSTGAIRSDDILFAVGCSATEVALRIGWPGSSQTLVLTLVDETLNSQCR